MGPPPSAAGRRAWAGGGQQPLLAGLFALILLVTARPAQAGPQAPDDGCLTDDECQGHYNQAVKLFEEGRFETALPEFQAAYQRRQMPWLLINIGRTLHRLGRSREALEHYERYKQAETKPDAETQERLEKYIAQARALTADPTTAPVPVTTTPATDRTGPATGTQPPGSDQPKPIYKKWWFWTAIGGGVVAVVIIGAAAGAAASSNQAPGLPSGVPAVKFSF